MADNTQIGIGIGGDTIRDKDRAGVKTQIVALDLNPAGSETLMSGSMPAATLPQSNSVTTTSTITSNGGSVQLTLNAAPSVTVQVSGTWQLDLVCQLSLDGSSWSNPVYMWEMDRWPNWHGHIQLGMNAISGATSRNGQFRVTTDGAKYVRIFAQAAGGTPGTATVTITASPLILGRPTKGFNVLLFDAVDLTATRVTPIIPQPGVGWRWDVSNTFTNNNAGSISGNSFTAETSDTYSFASFANAGSQYGGQYPGWNNSAGFFPGETIANAAAMPPANYIRWRWSCSVYPTAGQTTRWGNFFPPDNAGPLTYSPGTADQTSLTRGQGSLSQGFNTWIGAQVLATDATANNNGGKLRAIRCDVNQQLLTVAGLPQSAQGGISRQVRNLASLGSITAFANVILGYKVINTTASTVWVQLFNVASGSVTLGTTNPDLEIQVAANTDTQFIQMNQNGQGFGTAISAACTTAEKGNTAVGTGVMLFLITTA